MGNNCCTGADDSAQTVDMLAASPRPFPESSLVTACPDEMLMMPKMISHPESTAKTAPADAWLPIEGAWEDSTDTGVNGAKNVYVITDAALILLSKRVSELEFDGSKLQILGTELSAVLDGSRSKLQWSDGDVWSRSALDGIWKKAGFDGSLTVEGGALTTMMPSGEKLMNPLAILDSKRMVIMINGAAITGTLDTFAMKLTWSDGDEWTRGFIEDGRLQDYVNWQSQHG